MKTKWLIAIMVLWGMSANAQTYTGNGVGDTVPWFEPTYLYGTWYDTASLSGWYRSVFDWHSWRMYYLYYASLLPYEAHNADVYGMGGGRHINGKSFFVEEPIQVIGAAVAVIGHSNPIGWNSICVDTTIAGRLPEYLQLYTFSCDTPQLVTQAPWNLTDPHRFLYSNSRSYTTNQTVRGLVGPPEVLPLYEVYFPKAQQFSVNGKFMLGETHNNNHRVKVPVFETSRDSVWKFEHLPTLCLYVIDSNDFNASWTGGCESHPICPPQEWWYNYENYPFYHDTFYSAFYAVFPIMDTSFVPAPSECQRVQSVEACTAEGHQAVLNWSRNSNHSLWQVVYGPVGFNLDDAIKHWSYQPRYQTEPLDTSVQYVAYVRGWCAADSMWSDWSDDVYFTVSDSVTCSDEGFPDSPSSLDQFTQVFPNPAQDRVQVFSSFSLRSVEAYTLDGRRVLTLPASGLTAEFSTSQWPRGTYILLLHTPRGTATKKLLLVE